MAGALTRADEDPPVVTAVLAGAPAPTYRLLLAGPGSIAERRRDGTPVLVLAAIRNDVTAVTVLLRAGARDETRDADGRTGLRHAAEQGFNDIVAALVAVGTKEPEGHPVDLPLRQLPRSRGNMIPLAWKDDPIPAASTLAIWIARPATVTITGTSEQLDLLHLIVSEAVTRMGPEDLRIVTGYPSAGYGGLLELLSNPILAVPHVRDGGIGLEDARSVELSLTQVHMVRQAALNIVGGAAAWITPNIDRQVLNDQMAALDRLISWS